MEVKKAKVDESLIFMGLLTFIGGFINAYAFFTRGQAFVSMHTGNMAKIGLSLYQNDFNMLISSSYYRMSFRSCSCSIVKVQFKRI